MTAGVVAVKSLNLRDGPGGALMGSLDKGDGVEMFESKAGWTRIATLKAPVRAGWVASQYLSQTVAAPTPAAPAPAAPPMPDDPAHPVTVVGGKAITPDGRAFASASKGGFYTIGRTSLAGWLAGNPPPPDLKPSAVRVVRAISANEGLLEAVNSYDNSYMSFGLFQWTCGPAGDPGELPALLARLKATSPAAFQDCFGRHGLDVRVSGPTAVTGYLVLNGVVLNTAARKVQLRGAAWAYRFWRAGHHHDMRACELSFAASRMARFLDAKAAGIPVRRWLTSEQGVALVLDEHVNRPGHVPGTLQAAIAKLGVHDPANWTTADEARLMAAYVLARKATNMTDPLKRAERIAEAVHQGTLSDDRGSFQA
ncbi:MAG: SH3 domain-containing protein [Pseudomonadota bacterium]